jgi:hypothetical protein
MRHSSMRVVAGTLACAAAFGFAASAFGTAKGTLNYKAKKGDVTVNVTHANFVRIPSIGNGKPMRRLILSTADTTAALKACQNRMCADGEIGEGMTVDFDAGERLHYWFVANDQLIQYSGTAVLAAAKLTTETPTRLAGTLDIDDTASGGARVTVEFDASLVKEIAK